MLQKVATTGVNLDNVYDQTLRRIKEQDGDRSRLGMEVLMWVSHAERPLRIDELRHALAVELGATDFDLENIPPQDTVLGSCLGLTVVDEETSTVRLIHYTLHEYLLRPGVFPGTHRALAEICLTYLNYDKVKRLPANDVSILGNMPFLAYSSLHWGRHAKIELSDCAKLLALNLLSRYDSHISSTLLIDKIWRYRPSRVTHYLFTSLHCASYFGIDNIVATLIEAPGCDINQGDYRGVTPLILAAQQGNQGAVMLLLARSDIDPDKPDNDSKTPLRWASSYGHTEVVRLLLERDGVSPDRPDKNGGTPLCGSSFNGHEGVVRLLLARDDVNPDKPDKYGGTPLRWASSNGHEEVVRLLLTRDDVNPNKPDNDGITPLRGASSNGHKGVVRLLLPRGNVNRNKPKNKRQMPRIVASRIGHKGVARLLPSRGATNPDKPDNRPISGTPSNWHEPTVRPAVAQDHVTPGHPAGRDQTPPRIPLPRKRRQIIAEPIPRRSGRRRRKN